MDAWQGIGTAAVAALVSVAVTLAIRFWESTKVRWLITGEAHDEYAGGRPTGKLRATIEFHSVADGDAFGVVSTRSNGDEFEPFDVFERGKVAPGEAVEITMTIDPALWEQSWVALRWVTSPTARRNASHEGPHHLHEALWRLGGLPHREWIEQKRRMLRPKRQP